MQIIVIQAHSRPTSLELMQQKKPVDSGTGFIATHCVRAMDLIWGTA